MRNPIKYFKETRKQRAELLSNDRIIKTITVIHHYKVYKINVYYCPEINDVGIILGGAIRGNKILVDKLFINLLQQGKTDICTGIINHEIGHIINGHFSIRECIRKKLWSYYLINGLHFTATQVSCAMRNIQQEYTADDYAYHEDSKGTLSMLEYLYTLIKGYGGDVSELIDRYSRLGGTMEMKNTTLADTIKCLY